MISFACRCTHRIEVEDDMAGGMLQCTACGILVDVPSLDDLRHLDPDGTYHMDEVSVPVAGKIRTTPHFRDDEATDRRQTLEEFMEVDLVPPVDQGPKRLRPHYDPLTGELIRPVEVKEEPTPPAAPGRPVRKLSYARDLGSRVPAWWRPLLDAWRPESLLVWGIISVVLIAHLSLLGTFLIGILYFFTLGAAIHVLLFSHFGVVIDDTGPGDRDELPTPLRQMSFSEDIWRPFFQLTLAFALAFAPAIIARLAWAGVPDEMMLALCVLGYLMLPGFALTSVTSGYLLNLTPRRVLGTIRHIGLAYPVIVLCAVVGIEGVLWISGFFTRPNFGLSGLLPPVPMNEELIELVFSSATLKYTVLTAGLVLSVYFLHCACWMLGLCWRREHASFPWLMQRHFKRHGTDTTSRLKRLREQRQQSRASGPVPHPGNPSR